MREAMKIDRNLEFFSEGELSKQLGYVRRFVEWVEAKLAQHGVAEKLVPPMAVQRAEKTRLHNEQIAEALKESILSEAGFDDLLKDIQGELSLDDGPDLASWAKDCPPEPWTEPVDRFVVEQVEEARDLIDEKVQDRLSDLE